MTLDSSLATLAAWCDAETWFWHRVHAGTRDFEGEFERLNQTVHSVFILHISGARITVRNKPAFYGDGGVPTGNSQEVLRLQMYMSYLERCLALHDMEVETVLALDVHDVSTMESEAPVFCFQKQSGSTRILLPDVDFMQQGYYLDGVSDTNRETSASAVFVGSSTGGGILSATDVLEARSERLRLAKALVGHPSIRFLIGAAVQCDSEETAILLQRQPYYSQSLSWDEQLRHRYIWSVDGNGATCSRVVNTLRSQSVLLKMRSDNLLYYFKGLEAWKHYVPVSGIEDVERVLAHDSRLNTGAIRHEANEFFQSMLSFDPVHAYGAGLIRRYATGISGRMMPATQAPAPALTIGATVHIAFVGDRTAVASEWVGDLAGRQPIEGVQFAIGPLPSSETLAYRARLQSGAWTEWAHPGTYCGTRGQATSLTGLEMRLVEGLTGRFRLRVEVAFADGEIGVIRGMAGSCIAKTPVVALRVALEQG